nr:MAG TPA: Nucleotide modification associated domain 1 [Caudoviricetes sp.]
MEFREVTEWMNNVYERKNADYGDSFSKTFEKFGMMAVVVRLYDKVERISQISVNEPQVKEETEKDTLLDIANYAVMALVELSKRENN